MPKARRSYFFLLKMRIDDCRERRQSIILRRQFDYVRT